MWETIDAADSLQSNRRPYLKISQHLLRPRGLSERLGSGFRFGTPSRGNFTARPRFRFRFGTTSRDTGRQRYKRLPRLHARFSGGPPPANTDPDACAIKSYKYACTGHAQHSPPHGTWQLPRTASPELQPCDGHRWWQSTEKWNGNCKEYLPTLAIRNRGARRTNLSRRFPPQPAKPPTRLAFSGTLLRTAVFVLRCAV